MKTPIAEQMDSVRTALYRHFDADGNLLYIGISLNAIARLCQHRRDARWFNQIARIDVEWFDSRNQAETAEREAITAERPQYNKAHAITPNLLTLFDYLESIGKRHMVDDNGFILDEYMHPSPEEMEEMVAKLA